MSADGRVMAGCVNGDVTTVGAFVYVSTDSGATWTACTAIGARKWRAVTMTADGQRLAACAYGGYVYTSTDSGATWTRCTGAGTRNWTTLAYSPDGAVLMAGVGSGYLYRSTDFGVSWSTAVALSRGWHTLKCAGNTWIALASYVLNYAYYENSPYISLDAGLTWAESGPLSYWAAAGISADGSTLLAWDNEYLHVSTDSGATWTPKTAAYLNGASALAVSADGAKIFVAAFNQTPRLSLDRGETWYALGVLKNAKAVVANSAFTRLFAADSSEFGTGYLRTSAGDFLARARHVASYAPLTPVERRHSAAAKLYGWPRAARHVGRAVIFAPTWARHRSPFKTLAPLAARHHADWRIVRAVATRHRAGSVLSDVTPVAARHSAHSALYDTQTRVIELPPRLIHKQRRMELGDPLELSCDDGASVWSAAIRLDDPADFAPLRVGESVALQIGPTRVALMIDALQHSRADSPTYQINALSPVARYGSPYAAPGLLGAVGMAHAVCERLLAQTIDWTLPDWRLPESAAALEDTPLALAQMIVGAVGGRLESRLDGSLRARPYAASSPPYTDGRATALPDDQLYAYSAQIDAPRLANRFVITSGDEAADQIQVETIAAPSDPHAYTVRAYPAPWRPVELVHTGDSATAISARAEIQTDHDELIEIVAGTAQTRYPVYAVTATRWQYADLGAVRWSGPQTLAAGDAESYSLLRITYRARAWEWRVTNARTETIQFLAVEP